MVRMESKSDIRKFADPSKAIEDIKLLIFDKDGTLVATKEACLSLEDEVLSRFNVQPYPHYVYLTHPLRVTDWNGYYESLGVPKNRTQEAVDLFYLLEQDLKEIPVIEGVIETLTYFQQNHIRYHLLTHNGSFETVEKKVKISGLDKYFPTTKITVTPDRKERFLRQILEHYRINPSEVAFVTDTANDVMDGNKIGVRTVAVSNAHSFDSHAELSDARPYRIITDIRELPGMIR